MASIQKLLRNHYVIGAMFGALLGAICLFTSATIHYSMFGCGGAESVKTPLIALDTHNRMSDYSTNLDGRIQELSSKAYYVLLAQEFVTKGFDTITRFAALTVLGLLLCDRLQYWLRGQRAVYVFVVLVSTVQVLSALSVVHAAFAILISPTASCLFGLAVVWQFLGFLLICWKRSPIYALSPFRKCNLAFWGFSLPLFLVIRVAPMFWLAHRAAQCVLLP
jgi:hypothetical protein